MRSLVLAIIAFGTTGLFPTSSRAQTWVPADPLHDARYTNAPYRSTRNTVVLDNGRVLVAGGATLELAGAARLASAEVYRPSVDRWRLAGNLLVGRDGHTSTLLPNGKVLVCGGQTGRVDGILQIDRSCELFDPATNAFSLTANMSSPRELHVAVLLTDGRVLIAGGRDSEFTFLASAEVFDPATSTFSPAGTMPRTKIAASVARLADGRVLTTGGIGADFITTSSAELYDPSTDTWAALPDLRTTRLGHTSTLLAGGTVLIAGGTGPGGDRDAQVSAELFDPSTLTSTTTGSMALGRADHSAVLLPDGRVLVIGGRRSVALPGDAATGTRRTEYYDAALRTWSAGPTLNHRRYHHFTALLNSGEVLVTGGVSTETKPTLRSTELLTP